MARDSATCPHAKLKACCYVGTTSALLRSEAHKPIRYEFINGRTTAIFGPMPEIAPDDGYWFCEVCWLSWPMNGTVEDGLKRAALLNAAADQDPGESEEWRYLK